MKGTPTQLTCRGALHGYPKLTLSNSPVHMGQDYESHKYPKEKAPAYRNKPGTNNQGASTTPISASAPP
jgi:hypothetical protein